MSAADDMTEALVALFRGADEAEALHGPTGPALTLIDAAACVLCDLYETDPLLLLDVFPALRDTPGVRPSDVFAAAQFAVGLIEAENPDTFATLLDPDADKWIADACNQRPNADYERVARGVLVKIRPEEYDLLGRLGGLFDAPLSAEDRTTWQGIVDRLGEATIDDLRAIIVVHQHVAGRLLQRMEDMRELQELAAEIPEHLTVGEYVDSLHGNDRIRAEELLARQASVTHLRGEVDR